MMTSKECAGRNYGLYGCGEDGCMDPTCNPRPCVYPAPKPKAWQQLGASCCLMPSTQLHHSIPMHQDPDFAIDHKAPIVIDWPPPKPEAVEYIDTGPRPDLLAMIPDHIVPQTLQVVATPSPAVMKQYDAGTVTNEVIQHPLCPDGAMHMRINPKQKKPPVIKIPPCPPPIRGPPCRSWVQCVENTLINDQVRRPLARCCHKRPLPPLVIPCCKLEELKAKATEMDREKAAREAWCQQRECERLRSRERQGRWNFTVESLLEKKRQKEQEKEEGEKEATRQLIAEVGAEKKRQSDEQIAKANQLMLYRKGLIRDFHSALAYSKMMQEIENSKAKGSEASDAGCPMIIQTCYRKMMNTNFTRPDYEEEHKERMKQKKCSEQELRVIRAIDCRTREQKEEIQAAICNMKQEICKNMPEITEKYKKYLADPVCDDYKKCRDQEKMKEDIYEEIGDKLASDAFIESWEYEIDRQACEFREYKRETDAIRKAKEKQLIDDKVAYNIRKSEAAAKVLMRMKGQQKKREDEYDRLRDQWQEEWEEKRIKKNKCREQAMEKVVVDYNNRKFHEGLRRCQMDPCREWCKEQHMAEENYDRECEEKTERRQRAEDIALFNKAQAQYRHDVAIHKRYLDDVYDAKAKQEYLDEMKEMKEYAQECIKDWEGKGRSSLPMHQAMKKWDYDAGMYPFLFNETCPPINAHIGKAAEDAKKGQCSKYENENSTSSKRLGFASGGT